jgi:hypothetical protein
VNLFNVVGDFTKGCHVWELPVEAYEWHTWTGAESVRVVCIRFSLQGVHRLEFTRLSDMSNCLFVAIIT